MIQIKSIKITSMRLNEMISTKLIKKKDFKSTKCIEQYVSHRIIKFAINETRSKKIKNFFR